MKSQISLAFQKCRKDNRPALITYTVAGDNTKKKSLEILKSISEHADIILSLFRILLFFIISSKSFIFLSLYGGSKKTNS